MKTIKINNIIDRQPHRINPAHTSVHTHTHMSEKTKVIDININVSKGL